MIVYKPEPRTSKKKVFIYDEKIIRRKIIRHHKRKLGRKLTTEEIIQVLSKFNSEYQIRLNKFMSSSHV